MDQNENEDGWEWPFWKRYETWWTKMKNLKFKGLKWKRSQTLSIKSVILSFDNLLPKWFEFCTCALVISLCLVGRNDFVLERVTI